MPQSESRVRWLRPAAVLLGFRRAGSGESGWPPGSGRCAYCA